MRDQGCEATRLALEARGGSAAAAADLVRLTYPPVWRFCAHLVDVASADDSAQETFLRACRSLHSFRGEGGALAWLFTIARRVAADEIAERRRQSAMLTAVKARCAASPDAPDHSGVADINSVLRTLDEDRRTAFVLTQVFGFSYEEAAVTCQCPVGTIRSRVARARADLISAMSGSPDAVAAARRS